jgi:APA family basic amino acid/polyamine antiporter
MNQIKLVKGLGFLGLVAASFNCTVGGGIFRLPSIVYQLAGSAAPLVFLICFLVMLLIVWVFVLVGSETAESGGPYAYVEPVLGPYFGFICGVLLWLLAVFAMASVSTAYASFVANLIPMLDHTVGRAVILAVTFIGFGAMNSAGVHAGSRLSLVLSIAKLLPLLLLIAVGLPHLSAERLALPSEIDTDSLARATMLLVFAFTGAESALIPSGEIENPKQTLPRALFTALFLVLFLYLMVQFVAQSTLGGELANAGSAPLALVAEKLMGPQGRLILLIGAVLSTAGYLSAMTLALPRSLLAFAQKGYLPKALTAFNASHAPVTAIWVQALITWLLAISNGFESLAILANLSAILMYVMCAVAAIKLKQGGSFTMKKTIPWLAILTMSFLLTSVTLGEWASVLGLLVLATVLYFVKQKVSDSI